LVNAPQTIETGPQPAPEPPVEPGRTGAPADPAHAAALLQHGVWSVGVLAALGLLLWLVPGLSASTVAALVVAAVPGIAAQGLRFRDGERLRIGLIGVWAFCAAFAAGVTGGLAGPLAGLCAAPFAAALSFDNRRLVSGGAALSLVAFALALWASLASGAALPDLSTAVWLGALAVGSVATWIAASITRALRGRSERAASAEVALSRLEYVLAQQPQLLLTLEATGRLSAAYGAPPPGFSLDQLFTQGLIASAYHPDRAGLQNALLRAATHGAAEFGFTPWASLDRFSAIALRRLPDGRLIGALRDASIQHAREAALEAARSEAENLNAGKSRFLANMSHELRTPLNAVIGFSDVMRQRLFGPMPERYAEYAELIHESGGHLLDLINDVLDMSKIEAARYELHKEVFDAREPVSAALRLVRGQAEDAEIALNGVLPTEPVHVDADQRAIKQIVLNLLSNAMKFTPAGGSITVVLNQDAGVLELCVADTGLGVAPEDLTRLGRPFEQAGDALSKAQGSGLGLSLVRAFSRLHGGEMTIESTLGEGTAVTVRLPVVVAEEGGPRRGAEIIPIETRR
jgi:cell cycle sensor histidine kinase DivJ